MAIDMYDQHDAERRKTSHHEYLQAEGFTELVSTASEHGYRKATLSEINASADSRQGAEELFCWKGGLWVRKKVDRAKEPNNTLLNKGE